MTVRVELAIQQSVNSTLNSYLEKLLIMLTGSFGRKGTNQLHGWLVPLWGNSRGAVYAPTGDEIIAGLLPPNSFPSAVLSDHPERLRAVLVDSNNPANTAANSHMVERALAALDLLVVIDVAMTETARLAHYVVPASSQFEKSDSRCSISSSRSTIFISGSRPSSIVPKYPARVRRVSAPAATGGAG